MTTVFASISKLGEGYDVSEQDIPIEIQDFKLLEWLITRKKVNTNWKDVAIKLQNDLKKGAVRKGEVTDGPSGKAVWLPDEVELPVNRDLNYFDIDDITNQLITKCKEPTDKSLFGQYTSDRLKYFTNLKTSYQKNNTHLAEASSNLVQNIKYELPSLKKSIEHQRKQIQDLQRKEGDYTKTSNDFKIQYETACKEMKIKGENIRQELEVLISELPSIFEELLEKLKTSTFLDAFLLYKSWLTHIRSVTSMTGKIESIDDEFSVLNHLIKHGNELAIKVEKRKDPNYKSDEEEKDVDSVKTAQDGSETTIDWGITLEPSTASSTAPSAAFSVATESSTINWDGASNAINWDITIENEGETAADHTTPTSIPSNQSILDNDNYRKLLYFTLIEINAFYTQRLAELTSQSDTYINLNEMAGAPPLILKNNNEESLRKLQAAVHTALSFIENERVQNLIEMKKSQRVVERIAQSIQIKLDHKVIAQRNASDCLLRAKEIEQEIQDTFPRLAATKQYTLYLKGNIETELSKLFNGRKVRIFGEVDRI